MKNLIILLNLVFFVLLCSGCKTDQFSVDIKVIDGDGKAIESVEVSSLQGERKLSNSKGLATLTFKKVIKLTTSATKEGYYGSGSKHFSGNKLPKEVTIVLKKIKNPIAMYAKNMNYSSGRGLTIPGDIGKKIGFDLLIGDWVKPYGKGKISDFIFLKEGDWRDVLGMKFRQKLTIEFSNKGDGLVAYDGHMPLYQDNELRSDYLAPIKGYLMKWVQETSRDEKGRSTTRKNERNFYFRVRTKYDENGGIKSAHYGKIYGDFMRFIYYLNPTPNDRNVEFDPKKNLFKNLPDRYEVDRP